MDYIERIGTGIERIKRDLKNAKQQKPLFNTSGFFKITFRRFASYKKMSQVCPKFVPSSSQVRPKLVY